MTDSHDGVPAGEYCYQRTAATAADYVPLDPALAGVEVRVYVSRGMKFSRCPHWQTTEHGTVRCELLDVEVLDEHGDYAAALAMATAHFGELEVDAKVGRSWMLADEIKICDINLDEPDEGEGEPA